MHPDPIDLSCMKPWRPSVTPTSRAAASVAVLTAFAATLAAPAHALPPPPLVQQWVAPARYVQYLGTAWNDGIERALVDGTATNTIRVLNLETGVLEGSVPSRYGLVSAMSGVQFVDPDGSGTLRLLLAGRASAGAQWYVGTFNLGPGGALTLAWETPVETMTGVHSTRVLGGAGEDVVARRLSPTGDTYVTLHDGASGAVLWEQQMNGVPPLVTLLDSDVTGDGVPDWLMEVRTGPGVPGETRLFSVAPGAVAVPGGPASSSLGLGPTAPNPFVGDTRISWTLPRSGDALVRVFDPAGRHVRTLARGTHEAGAHQLTWDGRDDAGRTVPSGIYLVEVRSGAESQSRRMIRLP
jgi:hypothetical protein